MDYSNHEARHCLIEAVDTVKRKKKRKVIGVL